jgi:hypothetical protein
MVYFFQIAIVLPNVNVCTSGGEAKPGEKEGYFLDRIDRIYGVGEGRWFWV